MPDKRGMALLTDIGTEELGHMEMIGSIVTQLTRGEGARSFDKWGRGDYYVDHANAVFPASASGVPWSAAGIQSKGDVIADLMEDMAAEGAMA
jgi:spore coat protein JC